jgi:hypothetical protein
MGSPSVGHNLEGLAQACGFKQNVAQPRCIGPLKIEGIAENAMPCADLAGATGSGNSPQFCEYEDRPIAVRQTRRHRGRLASQPLHRKHISSGDP